MRGVITPIETIRRQRGDEAAQRETAAGRQAAAAFLAYQRAVAAGEDLAALDDLLAELEAGTTEYHEAVRGNFRR